ncbi:MAG: ribonuclease P protein component [Gemmatimonadales bacterium]|nr:ribonuclease P protein component [Gemmatimonadales bacterium]
MNWRSLSRNSDFQKVYREGVKRVGRLLVVYLLPAGENARAVVASRKVGGAVQRNRAKRLLREAMTKGLPGQPGWAGAVIEKTFPAKEPNAGSEMRGDIPQQDGKAGLWVVLIARQKILSANSREVREELDKLLEHFS